MATLVYGIIDPGESRMRIARAGHPYPLLVHPERGATYLTSGGGPPLGVVEVDSFPEHESAIEAGSTLLYTDGLVERRGKRIRDPESALAETASASPLDPETLCDNVIGRFVRGQPSEDNVALLAVRNAGIDE